MILLVTYQLKQPAGSYAELFKTLKSKDSWAHYMSSTWLVAADESPRDISQQLRAHIFEGDRLLVTELVKGYSGWLPKKAWTWIRKHRG